MTATKPRLTGLIAAFIIVALVAFAATGIAGIYIASETRDQAEQNAVLIKQVENQAQQNLNILGVVNGNSDLLIDCNTPGGKCFDESEKRSVESIGSVNAIAIAAAFCADQRGTKTSSEFRKCINQIISDGDLK